MALMWALVVGFVNEKRTGSVTLNFVDGRFTASEEKVSKRF